MNNEIVIPQSVLDSIDQDVALESKAPAKKSFDGVVIPESVLASIDEDISAGAQPYQEIDEVTGFAREMAGGLAFQYADEAEAFVRSQVSGTPYEEEKAKIDQEREQYRFYNPGTAFAAEMLGAIPSGLGAARALGRAGISRLGTQSAIEGGIYGTGTGNTLEERAAYGAGGAVAGKVLGTGVEKLTDLVKSKTTVTPEPITYEKGQILDYTRADGSNAMVRVMGQEGDNLILTTDILSKKPQPNKYFKVSKDSPDIGTRLEEDLVDGEFTRIEQAPVEERVTFTAMEDMPKQSDIRVVSEEVAGPVQPRSKNISYFNPKRHSKEERIFVEDLASKILVNEADDVVIIARSDANKIRESIAAKRAAGDPDASKELTDLYKKLNLNAKQKDDLKAIVNTKPEDSMMGNYFFDGGKFIVFDDIGLSSKGYQGKPGSRAARAYTIAHEMGHAAASRELGQELSKHLDGWAFGTESGVMVARPQAIGEASQAVLPQPKTELGKAIIRDWMDSDYYRTLSSSYTESQQFEEYVVDSIAKYAFADAPKAPEDAAKKYFWELGKTIRDLYKRVYSFIKPGAPMKGLEPNLQTIVARGRRSGGDKEAIREFIQEFVERNRNVARRKYVVDETPDAPQRTQVYREAAPEKWTESVYGVNKGPLWREAQSPGEFFDGIIAGLKRTYDRLTPMTDLLQRNVSREVGARAQRADETATKVNQLDFENYVAPATNIMKRFDDDRGFREATLLYSENGITKDELIDYVVNNYGADDAKALSRYLDWSVKKNKEYNKKVTGKDKVDNYLHRQQKFKTKKEENAAIDEEFNEPLLPYDVAQKARQVNIWTELKRGNTDILDKYQNPYFTNTRRIMNNEKLIQYMRMFGVKPSVLSRSPEQILYAMRDEIIKRGISEEKASYAITEIRRNLLGERKLMNQTLQALQTVGYAGSLAGPKSALLNLHDIPQTAVNQGPLAVRSWFKGIIKDKNGKMLSDSFGFSQQSKFGEFANALNQSLDTRGGLAKTLNETANTTTDALMKVSMFQLFDKVGKGGVLRSVQQRAVDDVVRGGWQQLSKKWGPYFSENELKIIARDLKKHGMDDSKYSKKGLQLTEELMMAGLGQQQLVSSGGRPAIWADHPNARIFLALRGFAMKQQAVALRNTFQAAKEGNVEEAKQWAIRYGLYSMGAFAAINEGRQILFGDGDPSARRVVRSFFDQLVGVMSLNSASISDYSWGKLQRGEMIDYVLANNVPIAIGVPAEAVEDAFDVLTGEKEPIELPETLPLFKQTQNLMRNIEEN